MHFEQAFELLRRGFKVRRNEWPDGQYVFQRQGYPVDRHIMPAMFTDPINNNEIAGQMMNHLIIVPRRESGYWGEGKLDYCPWTPSNVDLFCEDWVEYITEEERRNIDQQIDELDVSFIQPPKPWRKPE